MTRQPHGAGETRLEVVQAEHCHAAQIAEFIRAVWDPTATPESVLAARMTGAAQNVAEPGVPPPTWIALRSGRILGYVTTIPIRFWDGKRDWPAYWIKGLMVLPEARGGPVGYLVLKSATTSLSRTGAIAAAPAARRLFEALGYTDLGPVPNWIRPLAPHRILKRLDLAGLGLSRAPERIARAMGFLQVTRLGTVLGWIGGGALRASASLLRFRSVQIRTGPFDPAIGSVEVDSLWEASRGRFPNGVVRDSRYLMGRYPTGPNASYAWLAARAHGRLVGIAILRRPRANGDARLRGIRLATLADVVYAPGQSSVGLALLGGAERAARKWGADAIVAMCSSPDFRSLLRRQWYLPLSGNVHFLFREVSPEASRFSRTLGEWWLMRGDGSADEVF